MATFYGAIDLSKNELRQAQVQNLSSAPSSPALGQIYFNTSDATLYCCTNVVGPIWTAAKAGAGATPASTVTTQAIGDGGTVGTGANFAREDHKHGMPSFGSVTAETTFGLGSNNGSAASLARSDHTHGSPAHDASAHSTIPLSALAVPTVDLNFNSKKITNLAEPTTPSDAATRNYVDATVFGLAWKDACRVATTANIASLSGFLTVDGVTTVTQDRVLVKNQTTASQNGIWVVQSGAWYRATDVDSSTEIQGMCVFVMEGSTQADTAWVLTTNAPITIDTTNLTYAQFGTGGATYVGGAGLTLSANTFDVGAGTGITVAADSVAVDTAVIPTITSMNAAIAAGAGARKYATALTGSASPETVTHNLNTRDIVLAVLGSGSYAAVEVDWEATTVNTATVRYSPNLGAGYRVVVVG
jgi:hypothetical protein